MSEQGELNLIQKEIKRIADNIKNAYDSLEKKGATMPASKTSANLADTIDSIKVSSIYYDDVTRTLSITTLL